MRARQALKEILSEIPEDRLEEALSYLNYLRFKEEWEATEEILRDKKLMQSWRRGKPQAERGQTIKRSVSSTAVSQSSKTLQSGTPT